MSERLIRACDFFPSSFCRLSIRRISIRNGRFASIERRRESSRHHDGFPTITKFWPLRLRWPSCREETKLGDVDEVGQADDRKIWRNVRVSIGSRWKWSRVGNECVVRSKRKKAPGPGSRIKEERDIYIYICRGKEKSIKERKSERRMMGETLIFAWYTTGWTSRGKRRRRGSKGMQMRWSW